jgi:hypothetical protein
MIFLIIYKKYLTLLCVQSMIKSVLKILKSVQENLKSQLEMSKSDLGFTNTLGLG